MGAKHGIADSPECRQPNNPRRRFTRAFGVASVSILGAAAFAALVVNTTEPDESTQITVAATPATPPAPRPVSQEGTLVAVSPDSVTARSADGYTQTYLVNSNTTVITDGGGQPASATSHFTVNDEVEIVGTIQGGTALATAVADRELGHGHGPPMDYVTSQP
jgi:hypothetical protein